jgi:hypothetical protein
MKFQERQCTTNPDPPCRFFLMSVAMTGDGGPEGGVLSRPSVQRRNRQLIEELGKDVYIDFSELRLGAVVAQVMYLPTYQTLSSKHQLYQVL